MLSIVSLIENINSVFTDYVLVFALMAVGVFLTVKTGFVQVRFFGEGIRNMFGGLKKGRNTEGISPFASLATSLAAQLGTGNIVGAGAAIIAGGPGAVFWMWVSAFFGMATAYKEAQLAQKTKIRLPDGGFTGGAAYYIKSVFGEKTGKLLASMFSLFATIALGFSGVAVQSNSISVALKEAMGIPFIVTAVIVTVGAGLVLFKGSVAVARLSEKTVPVMALMYVFVCVAVILKNIRYIPSSAQLIFTCAFSSRALMGGAVGTSVKSAVSQGVKKGLFTNEAGMGSTPSAHALSNAPSPHYQGTLGIAAVFIDTFVMMSLTAFAVIIVLYKSGLLTDGTLTGSFAVTLAFSDILGEKGASVFVALSVLFFAFASILGWNLFGKASACFLFGEKSSKLYTASSLFFVFTGSLLSGSLVWALTDFFNTLMVLTNIPALTADVIKRHSSQKTVLKCQQS